MKTITQLPPDLQISYQGWSGLLLLTLAGTLFGQTPTKGLSNTPVKTAGSIMVVTHKRPQPQVPDLGVIVNSTLAEAQGPGPSENSSFNGDQGPGQGPIGPGPGCDVFPAPASIGTKVNLSYFGPPPSTDNPSLVGPEQLLKSGAVDAAR